MTKGFWGKLKKPIFALAPMANVTDAAFRKIIAEHGKPDVFWTEFVSADGLCSVGREKLLVDFWYEPNQHPIVAQIFGAKAENFFKAAKLIDELGFDGIDINMGCPDRSVEKQGAGAALMKNPTLAKELIHAAHEGSLRLPISVKTRIGYNKESLEEWLPVLVKSGIAALTLHLRTRKEMSLVAAHWELAPRIIQLVNSNPETGNRPLILGNGDVMNLAEAEEKIKESGFDGIMLGRAIFGNPWLFSNRMIAPTVSEKLAVMIEHTKLYEKIFTGVKGKNFDVMKKHYKAYVTGFDARPTERSFGRGAKELRMKLMETKNASEVEAIVKEFLVSQLVFEASASAV